jgi:hypothetical protein
MDDFERYCYTQRNHDHDKLELTQQNVKVGTVVNLEVTVVVGILDHTMEVDIIHLDKASHL